MKTTYQPNSKIKRLLQLNDIDEKAIDWGSYSPDIAIEDYLKNEYGIVLRTEKEMYLTAQAQHEKIKLQEFNQNAELVKKYNETAISVNKNIESYFKAIKRIAEKLHSGFVPFAIVKGRTGLGKSYQIEAYLKALKSDYVEVTSLSEAYLYRCLYENNNKIIWLKDFSIMLRSLRSIEELKAATETKENRLITNYNYSDKQEDLPKSFIFNGKILIDCNEIPQKFREDMDALISRAGNNYIELAFNFDEVKDIMFKICETDWQKEVTQYLLNCYEFVGFNELNLRTQWHCFQTYLFCQANKLDWRAELKEELKNNRSKIRSIVYSFAGNSAVRSTDLKKYLIRSGICSTLRTADRRLLEWEELGEIYKVSTDERNYYVSLNPIVSDTNDTSGGVKNGIQRN